MNQKNLILICITAVLCVAIICGTILLMNNQKSDDIINNTTLNNSNNTDTNNTVKTTASTTAQVDDNSNVYGEVVHNGNKDYSHYKCGGHIIYNGMDGTCNKCGAHFYGDNRVD
ncbi:MAG: hypothetical protein E7Z84_07300 [Methanosphaera stadtmanae]|nr:hypothetical protein [Methanosphaera stadtmanae]